MNRLLLATIPLLVITTGEVAQAQTTPSRSPDLFTQPQAQAQTATSLNADSNIDDTLYLNHDQVREHSLRLRETTRWNGITLPAGSVIRGQFEPIEGGLQYVATSVEVRDGQRPAREGHRTYSLTALSDPLHDVKDPRETNTGAILTDAAIGAAGGAALGEIFGDIDLLEVLGGAAAGAAVGNVTAQRVVVIEPGQVIPLHTQ
ncbi:uncharacterized protein XM38_026810 [Halomicronema hongdechloris C2206]|uniref:Glycine zipper 2TM domain-containing protein n=1 Tax=Halomicronema hongdechloris C2206 TaxID=1641165 RepID=A0A1Z3HNJ3_9CYAN|nr:hypothetical protein [Halomicronema hongdechloris]ASC71727.1 uncharacterized protein XM38_026810 [Halomicronema hongdechloris C2206]